MTLSEQIRALRKARGWSLTAAAEKAGIHRSLWFKVEHEERNVELRTIERLARAFEMTVADLVARVGDTKLRTMGERMRLHRERLGFDQGSAAAKAGMPREEWSRLERGVATNPRWVRIQAVAETLDIHPGELLYGMERVNEE